MAETAPKTEPKLGKKTALVAGGAGFIGSHLVATLISQNLKVICVDNLSAGKKDNLKEILTHPDFGFIEANINDPNFRLPSDVRIDYCFHLAGIEEYRGNKPLSLDTLLVNSLGTRTLLEISKTHRAKFILASSADLYSGAISNTSLRHYFGKTPGDEAVLSVHEAKRFSEALAFEYFKRFNLDTTIIRLKDVYGPKMNLERGDEIATLINQALNAKNLEVSGDGLKTLNPTYVSDVVFGLVKASLGNFSGEIFILVNPEKVTVESFAQTIKLVAGPIEIEHKKDSAGLDYSYHNLDLDNTRSKINWSPKVALAEGVGAVIQHERLAARGQMPPTDSTIPKLVEPISLTGNEKVLTKKVVAHSYSRWARLLVFVASSLLLLLSVVYPIGGFAAKSYLGRDNLTAAFSQLEQNKTEAAASRAQEAQNFLHGAQVDLQNVSWLLKIVGLSKKSANSDKLLLAGEHLAESLRSFAKASQTIVNTAEKVGVNRTEIQTALESARLDLGTSRDRLEETTIVLEIINWQELAQVVSLDREFMNDKTRQLSAEIEELLIVLDRVLAEG